MEKNGIIAAAMVLAVIAILPISSAMSLELTKIGEQYMHRTYDNQAIERYDTGDEGDYLYVTNGYGLEVWDVTDPTRAALIQTVPIRIEVDGDMQIQDNLLVIGGSKYLTVMDVSDPVNPTVLSTLEGEYFWWHNPVFNGSALYQEQFNEFVLQGRILTAFTIGVHITVVDLSDPINPRVTQRMTFNDEAALERCQILADDQYVYLLGRFIYDGDLNQLVSLVTYQWDADTLRQRSISSVRGEISPFGDLSLDAVLHNGEIYYTVSQQTSNFFCFDINDPANIRYLGESPDMDIQARHYGPFIKLEEDRLYFYCDKGAAIVDVTNGFANCSVLGSEDILPGPDPEDFLRAVTKIEPFGDFFASLNIQNYLTIWNASDPGDIFMEADIGAPGWLNGKPVAGQAFLSQDVLFCSDSRLDYAGTENIGGMQYNGVSTFTSLSNPRNPVLSDNWLDPGSGSGLILFPDQAKLIVSWIQYGGDWGPALRFSFYDISDPHNPEFLHTLTSFALPYKPRYQAMFGRVGVWCYPDRDHDNVEFETWHYANLDTFPERLLDTAIVRIPLGEEHDSFRIFSSFIDSTVYLCGYGLGASPEIMQYDVSPSLNIEDPQPPVSLGEFDLTALNDSSDFAYGVVKSDETAIVLTAKTFVQGNGNDVAPHTTRLLMLTPDLAQLRSVTPIPAEGGMTLDEDYLYVLNPYDGLFVYDVSNPDAGASLVASYDTPGLACQLTISDSLLIVTDTWSIQILQLANPNSTGNGSVVLLPTQPQIEATYPNPFNGNVTISYTLPTPGRYSLRVTDVTGREVAKLSDGWMKAGNYREILDAGCIGSGNYFVTISDGAGSAQTKPLILLK